ncbi:hypothetical protein PPIS_a3973 [Pseudoalteromonas piscicida]|uniref:Uncharacterized protein n=1 Tax=Pseudoalteromonas piscicida TaxID=43662 RepID=A0ABN5CGQ8_PSEO7|nr:hypothetical protein PPIS_a3973 [Pseudoalteromonas piscicida]
MDSAAFIAAFSSQYSVIKAVINTGLISLYKANRNEKFTLDRLG